MYKFKGITKKNIQLKKIKNKRRAFVSGFLQNVASIGISFFIGRQIAHYKYQKQKELINCLKDHYYNKNSILVRLFIEDPAQFTFIEFGPSGCCAFWSENKIHIYDFDHNFYKNHNEYIENKLKDDDKYEIVLVVDLKRNTKYFKLDIKETILRDELNLNLSPKEDYEQLSQYYTKKKGIVNKTFYFPHTPITNIVTVVKYLIHTKHLFYFNSDDNKSPEANH